MAPTKFPDEIQKRYDDFRSFGFITQENMGLMAEMAKEIVSCFDEQAIAEILRTLLQMARINEKNADKESEVARLEKKVNSWNMEFMVEAVRELFLLIDEDSARGLFRMFFRKALAAGHADVIKRYLDRQVGMDPCKSFIEMVNNNETGAKRVVFIARRPFFQILREAYYLRKNGWRTFLIHMDMGGSDIQTGFEAVLVVPGHLWLLDTLIKRLDAEVFHVQCLFMDNIMGVSVVRAERRGACVCEFYDVTSVFAPRDALCIKWNPRIVDMELLLEKTVCREADAVITRFPAPVHEELRRRHGGLTRIIEFQPYPCPEFICYSDDKLSEKDGAVRLVYAGMFVPKDKDYPKELFPERNQCETFRRLMAQGLRLDVFCASQQAFEVNEGTFADYHKLAEEDPHFRLLASAPPDVLAQAMAPYDFAINLFDLGLEESLNRDSHIKNVTSAKIFSYLEAGLPVIVTAEYEYMARIIEDNKLGFAVTGDEIDSVAELIKTFDYKSCVESIKSFNEEFGMDKQIKRITALYEEIIISLSK